MWTWIFYVKISFCMTKTSCSSVCEMYKNVMSDNVFFFKFKYVSIRIPNRCLLVTTVKKIVLTIIVLIGNWKLWVIYLNRNTYETRIEKSRLICWSKSKTVFTSDSESWSIKKSHIWHTLTLAYIISAFTLPSIRI